MKKSARLWDFGLWFLAMFVFCATYFNRSFITVIPDVLENEFHISHTFLGNMASSLFVSYTAVQIPIGYLFDRYNKTISLMAFTIASALVLALLLLSSTSLFLWASWTLFGAMTAPFWLGVMTAADRVPEYRNSLIGLSLTIQSAFATLSAFAFEGAYTHFQWWRLPSWIMVLILLVLTILLGLYNLFDDFEIPYSQSEILPLVQKGSKTSTKTRMFSLKNCLIYYIGPIVIIPITTLAGLWIGIHALEIAEFSREETALCSSMPYISMSVFGPLLGYLSDLYPKRREEIVLITLCCGAACALPLYIPNMPFILYATCLFISGIGCGGMTANFALVKDYNPDNVDVANGVANTFVMLGVALITAMIGWMLDPSHSAEAFRFAFLSIPVSYAFAILACIMLIIIKNKQT